MKKTLLILAALAFILVPSCTKQVEEEPESEDLLENVGEEGGEQQGGTVEFEATITETKTHLGDKEGNAWHNLWSVGDAINVNGAKSTPLSTGDGFVNTDYAKFTVSGTGSGPYYATYPASAVSNYSAGSATITIPATQNYNDGAYDPAAYIMMGKSDSPRLEFNPMMGLIQLTTTKPADNSELYVKSIVVEPVGDEKMSGGWSTTENYAGITSTGSETATSSITINAPNGISMDGSTFTFTIPAQNYASGVRFSIIASANADGSEPTQTMAFAKKSGFNVEPGKLYPLSAPAFKASAITLDCTFKTSSSAGFEWSSANVSTNISKAWRLAIYDNEACTSLVVQHDIPIPTGATNVSTYVWKNQGDGKPRFVVGGLKQGENYWCKVTDLANNVSAVVNFTTEEFTPVPASSPSGNTLVAEDFSEFGWGPAWLRGNAGHTYAGWAPVKGTDGVDANSVSCVAPSGVVNDGYYVSNEYSANSLIAYMDFSTAPRFNAGWGFVQDGGFTGYIQAGFLRMGGWNAHRQLIVLPELSGITTDKFATVDVTIKVAHSFNDDVTNNENFAVFIERNLTVGHPTQHLYTGAELNRRYPVSLTATGSSSQELTFRVNGVKSTDHLMVGPYNKVTNYNRYFLYSVKVEKVSESDTEVFDITDSETLELFRKRIAVDGETSLTGNVVNSFTVSSSVASGWTPIPGYTGTLSGNDKTITGLTKPFFADLQGTVQHLTLNSTINATTDDFGEGPAIFAEELKGGGSLDHCTSQGSVTFCPSTAVTNSTRYVAGLVGYVSSGSVTNCSNEADISFPHNNKSNDMIINVGGAIGSFKSSGSSFTSVSNSGSVSVAVTNATSNSRDGRIGGVVGVIGNGSSISGLNNSGSIEFTGTVHGTLSIGGVVGQTAKAVSSSENSGPIAAAGAMDLSGNDVYRNIGGIAGYVSANVALTNNINTSAATISNSGSSSGFTLIGGISGFTKGAISGGSNSASVTYSGTTSADTVCVGGIVGRTIDGKSGNRVSNITNNGIISVNTSSESEQVVVIGGIVGHHQSGNLNATNNGKITVTNLACQMLVLGGLVGDCADGAITSGSSNAATDGIRISGLTSDLQSYIGGIAGKSSATITANNSGKVEVLSGSEVKKSFYVGGIVGRSTANISSCTNSGNVSNGAQMSGTSWVDSNKKTQYYYMQIGGIVGYNDSNSAVSNCHNTGDVSNTGNSGAYLLVGGISSENDGSISNCDNIGDVTNSGDSGSGKYLSVGGVVGDAGAALSNCSNGTETAAGGTISNSGTSAQDVQVAGVAAYNKGKTFTSCYNKGAVTNSGNSASTQHVAIGGIAGWSSKGSSYSGVCYNTGEISNSGSGGFATADTKWDAADFCVRMGGLVGCADGANTFAGTSNSYNYNNGPVTESSPSKYVAIAGICGWANNASTNFAYCRNNADGDILIQNNERIDVVVGGILGVAKDASVPVSYTRNEGTITFKSLSFPSSGNNQGIFAGGILGVNTIDATTTHTITHCYNSGNIQNDTKSWKSKDLLTTHTGIGYSYVGGIAGAGDKTGYKYEYCYSRGDIFIYSNLKMRVGGIAAYSNIAPEHCAAFSDVFYMRQYDSENYGQKAGAITTNGKGDIGGIIAYCNTSGPFNDLVFYGGTLKSRGSYPSPLGGGILGNAQQSCTFNNCKVAGEISGSSSDSAGLFCATAASSYTITFTSCVVNTGTKHVGKTDSTTCNSNSDLTTKVVLGNNGGTFSGSPTVGSVTNPFANGNNPLDSL